MVPVHPYGPDRPLEPNVQKMLSTMMLEGYSAVQAYGWIGNAQQESYEDLRTSVQGDYGEATGIFQWHTRRFAQLLKYASEQDADWRDIETQVRFSLIEPGEKLAHLLLSEAKTIEQAVDAGIAYTRPSRPDRERRIALAKAIQDWCEKEH